MYVHSYISFVGRSWTDGRSDLVINGTYFEYYPDKMYNLWYNHCIIINLTYHIIFQRQNYMNHIAREIGDRLEIWRISSLSIFARRWILIERSEDEARFVPRSEKSTTHKWKDWLKTHRRVIEVWGRRDFQDIVHSTLIRRIFERNRRR